jgi:L-asparaginase II
MSIRESVHSPSSVRPSFAGHVPLVVSTRGGTIENIHYGSIAVVDARGRLLHAAGDPTFMTFTRSALKAFQALPFVMDDGPRALGLTTEQVALLTASHSGEDFHVSAVQDLLARAKSTPAELQCGCHVPYVFETLGRTPEPGVTFDSRHHNCSGKHSGFMAYCQLHGLSRSDYLEQGHPLQRRIRAQIAALLRLAPEALAVGTDGCSAPNLALPLSGLARLWAMLAAGDVGEPANAGASVPAGSDTTALERRADIEQAFGQMYAAMTAHPEYVSGTGRTDLHLTQAGAGDWVAKAGADGVQTLAIRSLGLGIAIKVSDGHADARHVAIVEVLRQLGLPGAQHESLAPWRSQAICNIAGLQVGERRPVFELQSGARS